MNILIVGEASWNDKNSFGNTVSNFFVGDVWQQDKFSCFYNRKQPPSNGAVVDYYNLSATDVLKGIFHFNISGNRFSSTDLEKQNLKKDESLEERKVIDKLHQKKHNFLYFCHEQVWRSKIWLNKNFKKFIEDNKPDIMFSFCQSPYMLLPVIKYLQKHTKCKIVLLVADDTYAQAEKCVFYRRLYLKSGIKKCILRADKLYGISEEMCQLYKARFGKKIQPLYKGCDLSLEPKKTLNEPLRFVYSGNLLWGRDDTLALIASRLEEINNDGVKATLEIYTNSTISPELDVKLNRGIVSKVLGPRPYQEIKKIMHDADVCLHVESFDEEAIETVKYSFSTKIIDCLQSGAQVFAAGPQGIASIEYLKKVDGSIVADSPNDIANTIQFLVHNKELILDNKKKTRFFAEIHHKINDVQNRLKKDLEEALG